MTKKIIPSTDKHLSTLITRHYEGGSIDFTAYTTQHLSRVEKQTLVKINAASVKSRFKHDPVEVAAYHALLFIEDALFASVGTSPQLHYSKQHSDKHTFVFTLSEKLYTFGERGAHLVENIYVG